MEKIYPHEMAEIIKALVDKHGLRAVVGGVSDVMISAALDLKLSTFGDKGFARKLDNAGRRIWAAYSVVK